MVRDYKDEHEEPSNGEREQKGLKRSVSNSERE